MSALLQPMGLKERQPESTGTLEQPPNSTAVIRSAIPIIARMCYSPFMTLTHARLTYLFRYDASTGIFTRLISVSPKARVGEPAGNKNTIGYLRIRIDGDLYSVHRLAWFYMTREWPKNQIDHINGIRDDNRFANLREATHCENQRNSRIPKTNTSGYKGVCFHKAAGKWAASIRLDGKQKHIGLFDTPEEASAAYIDKARELYGEFARIN